LGQSYEKSSAEQKKLVSFLCRDAEFELVSLGFVQEVRHFNGKVTKNRVQNKRNSFLFYAEIQNSNLFRLALSKKFGKAKATLN